MIYVENQPLFQSDRSDQTALLEMRTMLAFC
jgi:hypothetical protein